MLRVTIDGETHDCESGTTVLALLRTLQKSVPALCDDPRLEPIGGCRLCIVEVQGQPRPVAACTTMLADRMEITTHSPQLESLRRTQLRLLARHYPRPDPGGAPANRFHRLVREYGLDAELGCAPPTGYVDDSHPCIHVDMSRCIHCFRCVRICEEVAGRFVWRAWDRGDRTEIRPADRTNLRNSDCVSCGACVDTCPSGALLDRTALSVPPPTNEIRTVCSYCGVGCEMHVGTREGRVISARPVLEAPVNKGHLCVKGRYGWEFVHAADRVTRPMLRDGDHWQPVSWERAVEFIAHKLRQIIGQHGPNAVGVLGSARATNEENYLAQKFARVVLGTHNVDCCARVCHAPTAAGMKLMLGTGAATNSFDDIEQAQMFLICGSNPTENHPIVGDRIRQAVRAGAELVVIDPRETDLARDARFHLQLRPGTNIPLLNALAHTIVSEELYEPTMIASHIENWEEYRTFITDAKWSPQRVAGVCGLTADNIREVARLYATRKPAMCFHGLGVTEHVQGTEGVMCLVNLAVLTGNLGRAGSGVNPLRGRNNVQGSAHMGCDPGVLTGGVAVSDGRERFESVWQTPLPTQPGLNLLQMMDAAEAGRFKALWAMGYDVGLTNPHAESTLRALRSLELVIVQDLFLTETARQAGTVFLPACSTLEKDGTFMNSERRIQRVRHAIEPLGQSRPDWQIICDVARMLGRGDAFAFNNSEQIWEEIRRVWPAGAGITYQRLESGGFQWPCPHESHPGTTVLHTDLNNGDGRQIKLRTIHFHPTAEQTSAEYPLLLNTGRALYQFNAGTMTGRSRTAQLQPVDVLQVSAEDAAQLQIVDGQWVRVVSRHGETTLPAHISDRVKPGELFATFQSPEIFLNRLTSLQRDGYTQTPEYKVTAVRLEPAM